MIICPTCNDELIQKDNNFECLNCNFKAMKENDIIFFHPDIPKDFDDYDSEGLDNLYKAENKHFWFISRTNLISDMFKKYISKNAKVLEIGAGTGYVARKLILDGYNVSLGEIYKNGLEYAKTYGIRNLYQFNLMYPPFKDHFDVIGLFDVLEHIEDEDKVINNLNKILTSAGCIVLTVPAHMWLWGEIDVLSKHKRRYEINELVNLLEKNMFEIIEAKTFFISLLPLLYLRKFKKKDNSCTSLKINPLINNILRVVTCIENYLLRFFKAKIGGSIIIVAKKIN